MSAKNISSISLNKGSDYIENPKVFRAIGGVSTSTMLVPPLTTKLETLVRLVNQYRASRSVAPLAVDARLVTAARRHNNLMATNHILSHQIVSVGERPPFQLGPNNDRLDAVGYNWTFGGENIARGFITPTSVLNAWKNSPPHNSNLLTKNAKNIGVAYNPNGSYWTLDVANTTSPTIPL